MKAPAGFPALTDTGSSDIHLWQAEIGATRDVEPYLRAWLTAADRARAQRFRRPADRARFLLAHAILRRLLGWYLAEDPAAVVIQLGERGKPHVVGYDLPLHFNMTHSGDAALLAFSRRRQVGVDLEALHPTLDVERLAARFFAPGEARELRALPAPERPSAFLRVWVAKEAFAKGIGAGITGLDLRGFEVPIAPGWSEVRAISPTVRAVAAGWHVRPLTGPAGCAAALAASGDVVAFRAGGIRQSAGTGGSGGREAAFNPALETFRWIWPWEPAGPEYSQ